MLVRLITGGDEISCKAATDLAAVIQPSVATAVLHHDEIAGRMLIPVSLITS